MWCSSVLKGEKGVRDMSTVGKEGRMRVEVEFQGGKRDMPIRWRVAQSVSPLRGCWS